MIFNKKKQTTTEKISDQKEVIASKDRLFFHDIINQTHGLLLYLGYKELSQSGIEHDEIKTLVNEVKTIQSLVKDHFNLKHKNLAQTFEWVNFEYLEMATALMIEAYFPAQKIKVNYNNFATAETQIYYPTFYRIINNVVKNIAESKPSSLLVTLELSDDELKITTQNELSVGRVKNIPEYLEQVILNENPIPKNGLGLESVYHLAESAGGSFHFEVKDGHWRNEVRLPTSKKQQSKIAA